ncbi:MAG TPA: RNA methyltransferase [Alphaproteobacteria bacterium]
MSKVKTITSPANDDIKAMRALDMRKTRKETGLFLAEGLRHVIEGVENGWELERLAYKPQLMRNTDMDRVKESAKLCLEVNDAVLEKLSHKDNPQSVIGVFKQRLSKLEDLKPNKCIVALEQVRDPGNLGTILRTVDGIGADAVILIDQCCDPFSTEAVRASMGSLFAVPIAQATKNEFIKYLEDFKGTVVGTALNDRTVDYRKIPYTQPVLLTMGNEQAGLSEDLMAALPNLVKLPMNGRADSLNLAIATGVMLYHMLEA